jgi:hypothetical protein
VLACQASHKYQLKLLAVTSSNDADHGTTIPLISHHQGEGLPLHVIAAVHDTSTKLSHRGYTPRHEAC